MVGLVVVGLLFFKRFLYFGNSSKFLDQLNFNNQLWKLNILRLGIVRSPEQKFYYF